MCDPDGGFDIANKATNPTVLPVPPDGQFATAVPIDTPLYTTR